MQELHNVATASVLFTASTHLCFSLDYPMWPPLHSLLSSIFGSGAVSHKDFPRLFK